MCRLSPGEKEVVCGRFPPSVSLDCLCSTTKGSLPGIPGITVYRAGFLSPAIARGKIGEIYVFTHRRGANAAHTRMRRPTH